MIGKYLMNFIFTKVLFKEKQITLQDSIKKDALSVGLKLVMGLGIVSIMAFSIIQVVRLSQDILDQYKDGDLIQLVCLSLISIASLITIIILFKPATKKEEPKVDLMSTLESISIPSIGMSFASGIREGFKVRERIIPRNATTYNHVESKEITF